MDVGRKPAGEANLRKLLNVIFQVKLIGNEDWPEDVFAGLAKASSMRWAPDRERRQLLVVIGDAETHPEDRYRSMEIVRDWVSASPNRSVNAVNTGSNDPARQGDVRAAKRYFQELGRLGNGQYLEDQGDLLGSILDILIVR